jgi:hypothetical protein
MNYRILMPVTGALCLLAATRACAQATTAFTYQGRLADHASPANGNYDLRFTLYAVGAGGVPLAGPLTNAAVAVSNGLFTVTPDFGASVFSGPPRWLEIGVRPGGSVADFTLLNPRQPLTPSPYALFAANAGGLPANTVAASNIQSAALTADKLAPGQVVKSLNTLSDDVTLVPGANITITPSGSTLQISATTNVAGGRSWALGGNTGTAAGVNYLGTSDNQPLELKVNGARALRLEPNYSPNVIAGHSGNAVSNLVAGAVIGGGGYPTAGLNLVTDHYGTVGGGAGNQAGDANANVNTAMYATVGGGHQNLSGGTASTVGGGEFNAGNADYATAAGGQNNAAAGPWSVVSGGLQNTNRGSMAFVGGGLNNVNTAQYGAIVGGSGNTNGGYTSFAGGGYANVVTADFAVLSGGLQNTNQGYGNVLGGGAQNLTASDYSSVAGGQGNAATGLKSSIGGGEFNRASAGLASVAGGGNNAAMANAATVAGGNGNRNSGSGAAIGGGVGNLILETGSSATIGGGSANLLSSYTATIGGGQNNTNSGQGATIPGGTFNAARGLTSFAGGHRAKANHDGAFVWADSTEADIGSTSQNQFIVRASGGFYVYTAGNPNPILALDPSGTLVTSGGLVASNGTAPDVLSILAANGLRFTSIGGTPNLIGGYSGNYVTAQGAAIGGGGTLGELNRVTDDWGAIGGGLGNQAGGDGGLFHSPYATVGGGKDNAAKGTASTVGGGFQNLAASYSATVAGGVSNACSGLGAFVGGGRLNSTAMNFATIGGGEHNSGGDIYATVAGGLGNSSWGKFSVVSGGENNAAVADSDTIGGGWGNRTFGLGGCTVSGGGNNHVGIEGVPGQPASYGTISGGNANSVSGISSTVGGGTLNWASADAAVVAGGYNNTASGTNSAIVGGGANRALGDSAVVAGGYGNTASGKNSAIAGGAANQATGDSAVVAGGSNNRATAADSTIAGGGNNQASSQESTVSGGANNLAANIGAVVGGGIGNNALGTNSCVPGGYGNHAVGDASFAAGNRAQAYGLGSFAWSDGLPFDFPAYAWNSFNVRATGGVYLWTGVDGSGQVNIGAQLPPGSGTWLYLSDRNGKGNFATVDGKAVLEKLASLPIQTWNYKTEANTPRHIGPMAQDFYAAFGVGPDDKHIATVDADGVALAAIQGLNQKLEETRAVNAELKQRLERLEQLISAKNGGTQ